MNVFRHAWPITICRASLALIALMLMFGAGCAREAAHNDYLLRVGGLTLTLAEFDQAVRTASEEAFPEEAETDPAMLGDLHLRVLNQLSEEMVLAAYAADHGIVVTEEELEAAVDAIKADYPDATFEETLLENAISYHLWKRRLAARLLAEKVIARALVDQVRISAEDVAEYYETYYPQGIPESEDTDELRQRIITHLRRHKGEAAYKEWIDALGQSYPVEINRQAWEHWTGSNP